MRQCGDALPQALSGIGARELGPLTARGARDAVGDRAVAEEAGNEDFLAGENSHVSCLCVAGAVIIRRAPRPPPRSRLALAERGKEHRVEVARKRKQLPAQQVGELGGFLA